MTQEDEVVVSRAGRLGHLLLNRPSALNSLTYGMVGTIANTLREWATDDAVRVVLVSGAGERGLCAGGDIVSLYREIAAGSGGEATFWREEYTMNAQIARYPKPYVALMDGVTLGGGVGVSAHGSIRVVTERTKIGMPEVGIGFVPDVGGTWLLSRAPGELGTHAGLTGGTFGGSDAIALGLADRFVPSGQLPALVAALETEDADAAVARFAVTPPASELEAAREWIDDCYRGDDALAIVTALESHDSADARAAASVIRTKSPTSVAVTLAALRRARRATSLERVLDQEFRVSLACAAGSEMVEGIRAQVIDKDRTPHWVPDTLEQVGWGAVEAHFAPLGANELGLG